MKKHIAAVLCAFVVAGFALAQPSKASAAGLGDADTLRQLSRDWADATKAIDVNRLSQIIADDWKCVGSVGNIKTKESVLSYVQTRDNRLESFEFGPMDVKVLGNVAVVQGSITQHYISKKDGQHAVFSSVWMDVWEKRGEKWVVVRSQTNSPAQLAIASRRRIAI
jgi:ketosteroid isomerase-like protein